MAVDALDVAVRDPVAQFVTGASLEISPKAVGKLAQVAGVIAPGTRLYIASVPGEAVAAVQDTAIAVRRAGFTPVPHLPARGFRSQDQVRDHLVRLADEAGVTEILVIAGGNARPEGPFDCSLALLRTGLPDRVGITRIGLAGHPEGSPDIPAPAADQAIREKTAFQAETDAHLHLVTQFGFDAGAITAWERRIRTELGNRLPVTIGLAGPASLKSLLHYAALCGVGNSIGFLTAQARNVTKLFTVSTPDAIVADLAPARNEDPHSLITGCHLFAFGGLARAADWLATAEAR